MNAPCSHAVDTQHLALAVLHLGLLLCVCVPVWVRRLRDFGPNRLTPADKPGFLARLWGQLNNILIYILIAAAIVEGALQSWAEFGLVLGVVIINTAIGLIQEGKAEKVGGGRGGGGCWW